MYDKNPKKKAVTSNKNAWTTYESVFRTISSKKTNSLHYVYIKL